MRNIYIFLFTSLLIGFLFPVPAQASFLGGEFTWEDLGSEKVSYSIVGKIFVKY